MNMLLFVWTIIFISCQADSGDGDGDGYYDYYGGFSEYFDEAFESRGSSVIDFFPESPLTCPCTPRGAICDILATCQRDAGPMDLVCIDGTNGPIPVLPFLFCGGDFEQSIFPPELEFLFTPVFVQSAPLLPGGIGICASSSFGIVGIIRAIFENIGDLIEEFSECESSARRLQDGTKPDDIFHGSPRAFENVVQLLEWKGPANKQELVQMIFKEGGIGHLAAMMKQKQSQDTTTPSRRLLDDSGDGGEGEFGLCEFLFMQGFFDENRRRLNIYGPFDAATAPFEFLISELFTNADCDNNKDSAPIICIIKDIMNNRRRLESDDSGDSGDGGDGDRLDFSCCGNIGTSIQLTTTEQATTCANQIDDATECLGSTFTDGCIGSEE